LFKLELVLFFGVFQPPEGKYAQDYHEKYGTMGRSRPGPSAIFGMSRTLLFSGKKVFMKISNNFCLQSTVFRI